MITNAQCYKQHRPPKELWQEIAPTASDADQANHVRGLIERVLGSKAERFFDVQIVRNDEPVR